MKSPVTTFWGKLERDPPEGAAPAWHPLIDHCADVAATCRALLEQPVLRRWLAALAGLPDLNPVQRDRLAFLSALHDVGKVNVGFQNKRMAKPPFVAGHVGPILDVFDGPGPEGGRLAAAMDLEPLMLWVGSEDQLFELLLTLFSHHGRPVQPQARYDPRLWQPAGGLDPFEGAAELRRSAERWFPEAFRNAAPLDTSPRFQHGFNGLLTLADWIASDDRIFPFSQPGGPDRFLWATARSNQALTELGLAAAMARRALGPQPPDFSAISASPPRELQSRMLELPVETAGSMTVLEAETGAGKTEAALAHFLRLFHAGQVDGLYFALPTRTAATQIHGRVRQAVARAFPAEARPPVVLAVPGYLAVDDVEGKRLAPFKVLWADDDSARWRYRGWAAESPKRFLAGSVVVGTIDQVLLSALAVSHSHLRAAALSRHLVVVDEVHASDAYMTRILEAVVARQLEAGGHVLLMSATLGSAARTRLTAPGQRSRVPNLTEAVAVPYPLITHVGAPASEPRLVPLSQGAARLVHVDCEPVAADAPAVAELAVRAAVLGARVLVIRNTVGDCVATQQAVEAVLAGPNPGRADLLFGCGEVPAPHHSRYAKEDREALDAAIEARFGETAPAAGCVAIATQTVQQSLDIDADLMLTDLCPADVLLQRFGRLHRHVRPRPAGFEVPHAVVLVPMGRDLVRYIRDNGEARGPHGLGTVYPDLRVLESTWRQLERHEVVELPRLSRELVEGATHPMVLESIAEELGGAWGSHGQWIVGSLLAHVRIAGRHVVDWDIPFPATRFPPDDERVATRLGADDRIAEFEEPWLGPFGRFVRRLTIPHHLARHADPDAGPTEVEVGPAWCAFRFGDRRYRYDRLGLRPERDPGPNYEESDG